MDIVVCNGVAAGVVVVDVVVAVERVGTDGVVSVGLDSVVYRHRGRGISGKAVSVRVHNDVIIVTSIVVVVMEGVVIG